MTMNMHYLRKPRRGKLFLGVCAAFANWTGINVFWWRLLFFILLLPGGLPGLVPYLVLALIIPSEQRA